VGNFTPAIREYHTAHRAVNQLNMFAGNDSQVMAWDLSRSTLFNSTNTGFGFHYHIYACLLIVITKNPRAILQSS